MDVDRKTLGMYDWDCVDEASKLNDAGVTFKLKLSDVIQITSVPNTLSKLFPKTACSAGDFLSPSKPI